MGTIAASVAPLGNRHFPLTAQIQILERFSSWRKILALVRGAEIAHLGRSYGLCCRKE